MLGEYRAVVTPIIRSHRGSIISYLGDGIFAAFGATRTSETAAADTLAAAEEVVAALELWVERGRAACRPALESGIGVAWGTVTVGAIGGDGRLEYAVIGDAVNRAAKLQALTKTIVARALVTGVAWTAALEQGFQPRRPHQRHRGCALPGLSDAMGLIALG